MPTVRYTIEWHAGADPVRGTLIASDDVRHDFAGWLEFLTVVQALRKRDEPDCAPEPMGR